MKKVTPLQVGSMFTTKRMEGASGQPFPRHTASVESVLVVTEGRCVLKFTDQDHAVEAGESFIVPSDAWHQVVADPAFKAVHVMPHEIKFEFAQ